MIRIEGAQHTPQVIVSVRLESTQTLDTSEWVEWLRKAPSSAANLKVEGWYGSFSTLVLLNMPLRVWHVLPAHPAVSFIGYVTTGNLASAIHESHESGVATGVMKWRHDIQDAASVVADSLLADSAIDIGPPYPGTFGAPTPPAFVRGHSVGQSSFRYKGPEGERRGGTEIPESDATGVQIYYACPYRKRNPRKFNARDWPTCAAARNGSLSHVKEHIRK